MGKLGKNWKERGCERLCRLCLPCLGKGSHKRKTELRLRKELQSFLAEVKAKDYSQKCFYLW